ncbi:hypothetical protein R1flu_023293 [Riccia fluitans]|uniref:Uncharacterized protein n=1 Tax=Riccia fluitans TaxID=41844 RepID=A0ABD1XRP7_9MARC
MLMLLRLFPSLTESCSSSEVLLRKPQEESCYRSLKFERYLVGEVLAVGSDVKNTEKGKKVLVSDINAYEVLLK